jgi:hypothetical protein
MRVTSQLADMELEVDTITREGDLIVVETARGAGIETRIEIGPRDATRILARALRNPAVIAYVLALPLLFWRARRKKPADPADPWSHP